MLLQAVGTGLEQLGEIPLAGPALEGYGKILSGLTDVMNDLAGKAAITTKEGVFSVTEEKERLQGLDPKAQYVKTTLWHRGIPLVQEYPFATGQYRYYLQIPTGPWIDPNNRKRWFSSTFVTVLLYAPHLRASSEDMTKRRADYWIKEKGARFLDEKKGTVLLNYTQGAGSQHLIKLVFAHRNCDVFLQLSGRPGANSDCTEEMILQFARLICHHLDEYYAGGKPAAPPF